MKSLKSFVESLSYRKTSRGGKLSKTVIEKKREEIQSYAYYLSNTSLKGMRVNDLDGETRKRLVILRDKIEGLLS